MRLTAIAMGIVLVCGQACFGDWLLEWGGTVTEIKDGAGADVSWGPVTVGDTVSASLRYDPATFDPGVGVTGDGLDYGKWPGTLWMEYSFSSTPTVYAHSVTSVRARDGGDHDQWNWISGDDLLVQQNDHDDSSWDLPLPSSFEDMHDLYVNAFSKLMPADATHFVWHGYGPTEGQTWALLIDVEYRRLTSDEPSPGTIPAPAAVLLSGLARAWSAGSADDEVCRPRRFIRLGTRSCRREWQVRPDLFCTA